MKLMMFYMSCFLAFVAGHILNYSAIMYSLETFQSSTLAGMAYGLCFGSPIIFGWMAGAYIDRYSAKRVLLVAQNAFILGGVGMWWVVTSEPVYSIYWLLISSFIVGIGWAFVAPSRLSGLVQYVSAEKLPQSTITFNLLVMIGFGLAPVALTMILDEFGWSGVLGASVIMFLVSSALLLNGPNRHVRVEHSNLKQEWFVCYEGLKSKPVLIQLLLAAIIGYLMMGPMQVVLPQLAEGQLGLNTVEKGQYLGLVAVSLILGGVAAMKLKNRVSIGHSILFLLLLCGLSIAIIGEVQQLWLSCLVLVVGTGCAGIVVSFIVAGLQHHTPIEIRGRVMSIYTIISQVISAMAGVLSGWLAQQAGIGVSLYVIGALFFVFTLLLAWKGRHLKHFKRF